MPRKATLLGMTLMFILGNMLCALAPNYATLMAARVITALCHGAFFGIGSVVAAGLVAPNKRAQAIAMMFTGLTLANVLGVPLGTALGQYAGWRSTFWAVSVIGVIAAIAQWVWLPKDIAMDKANLASEFKVLGKTQRAAGPGHERAGVDQPVQRVHVYRADPAGHHRRQPPWRDHYVAVVRRRPDRRQHARRTPGRQPFVAIAGGHGAGRAWWCWRRSRQTSHSVIPAAITLVLWGMFAFALCPILQLLIIDQAHEAPNLGSTLNQSAFNLGNAAGAWIGGLVVASGADLADLPWTGALVSGLTVLTALYFIYRQRRTTVALDVAG